MKKTFFTTKIIILTFAIISIGYFSHKIFPMNNDSLSGEIGASVVKSLSSNNDEIKIDINKQVNSESTSRIVNNKKNETIVEKISEVIGKKSNGGKVFFGLSKIADPNLVKISELNAVSGRSGRSAIGTNSFNPSSSEYIYFIWPESYDPSEGCYYATHLSGVHCIDSSFGSIDTFIRGREMYEGIVYLTYRSPSIGGGGNMTIK